MSSALQAPALDMNKLNQFIGQFVSDLGATVHSGMVVIGEKLGLYKALASRPMTSAELAKATQTDERYLREWLASQAAGGYITYFEDTKKFGLSEEQAFTLANPDSPAYLPGAFELALGSLAAVPRIAESFRSGAGMGWHEHVDGVFHGCEKFFRPGYAANEVILIAVSSHREKQLSLALPIEEIRVGDQYLIRSQSVSIQSHKLPGFRVRQRIQQDTFENRKQRSIRADAERQRRNRRESWRVHEHPQSVANV
jgi:hypothetical protein